MFQLLLYTLNWTVTFINERDDGASSRYIVSGFFGGKRTTFPAFLSLICTPLQDL